MGTVVSKAANGIGGVLGNVLAAPLKSVFGGSCEGICSGPWDAICFIEHLCVSNLVKLLMILGLCFIILMFLYLLLKLGICQCIIRSLCKICWAGCETYWFALEDATCFLWHKLKNTKRVNRYHRRRRFQDIEVGISSSSDNDYSDNYHHHHHHLSFSKRKNTERDRHRLHSNHPHHHHVKLKTSEVSVHLRASSRRLRSSRRLQLIKGRKTQKEVNIYKRRRMG
ncbi:PREDICTED: uncharacterized protein LOC18595564 [Theobroma cacao]|uniref:Uncharacterized protein LOC18595564 n=1 Tax=Theobroma cacao TaxID=3641 RepID=A0AB32UZQ5_THECC|nr:PREDICTED: uncharacterized protein LOC18595564 [Theobroma cacao]